MAKTLYSVQANTRIDSSPPSIANGGTPGYFSVGMFEDKDVAIKIKNALNKIKDELNDSSLDKINSNTFHYGYQEGLDGEYIVKEVYIPENGKEWLNTVNIESLKSILLSK